MGQSVDQTTIKFNNARTFTPTLGADGRIVMPESSGRAEQVMNVASLEAAARCSTAEGQAMFQQKAIGLQQRIDQNTSTQPNNAATPGFTMVDKPKGMSS